MTNLNEISKLIQQHTMDVSDLQYVNDEKLKSAVVCSVKE